MVLDELRRIGFSNMLDYMRVTGDGDAFLDLSAIDRDKRDKGACVKYFVWRTTPMGGGRTCERRA
jgi:hypothetical protein